MPWDFHVSTNAAQCQCFLNSRRVPPQRTQGCHLRPSDLRLSDDDPSDDPKVIPERNKSQESGSFIDDMSASVLRFAST